MNRASAVRLNDDDSVRTFEALAAAAGVPEETREAAMSALEESSLPSARAALERLTRNDPERHAQYTRFDPSSLTPGERQHKLDDLLRSQTVHSSMREIAELLSHDSTLARATLNHPNELVRRAALTSSALSSSPDYTSVLRAGLDDDSEMVRGVALDQLAGSLSRREMIEELEDQLHHDRASVLSQRQIIEWLFHSYGTEGRERLNRLRETGGVPQSLQGEIEQMEKRELEGYDDEGC